MKIEMHAVLVQPLLTEKITGLREKTNTVGFIVHPDANRVQIKQAVESLLKVKVEKVNVLNIRGKVKWLGWFFSVVPTGRRFSSLLRRVRSLRCTKVPN